MVKTALLRKSVIKIIGENLKNMSFLENIFHGNLVIHQDLINKLIKELIAENETLKDIKVSINGELINLTASIHAGGNSTIQVKLALSPGIFEFNRVNRFIELPVNGPVIISFHGVEVKARLRMDLDPDPAKRAGTPEVLVNLLQYLDIKEDLIKVDFNKIPGFNRLLQSKLGFVLKYLEITKLELGEGTIIIHPAVRIR